VSKRKVVPCASNYLYEKFSEFWTSRRSPIQISKGGCLKIFINKKQRGAACQTQWLLKRRPAAGLTCAPTARPCAGALQRTSATCAAPCTHMHCACCSGGLLPHNGSSHRLTAPFLYVPCRHRPSLPPLRWPPSTAASGAPLAPLTPPVASPEL
jgi:hypothetical protein